MRLPALSALFAALVLPSVVAAAPKASGAGAKSPPACGVKVLPLVVGNTWTYSTVAAPMPAPPDIARLAPPLPKGFVITVKSIEPKGPDTVVTLEEKITYDLTKDVKKPICRRARRHEHDHVQREEVRHLARELLLRRRARRLPRARRSTSSTAPRAPAGSSPGRRHRRRRVARGPRRPLDEDRNEGLRSAARQRQARARASVHAAAARGRHHQAGLLSRPRSSRSRPPGA